MRLVLGNRHAAVVTHDAKGKRVYDVLPRGKRATVIDFPKGHSLGRAFIDITSGEGVWAFHTRESNAKPAWVASDSPGLAALVSEHYGDIPIRDLEDPYGGAFDHTEAPAGIAAAVAKGTNAMLGVQVSLALAAIALVKTMPWLKTNAGNDFAAKQLSGGASATAVAKWVALTANTTAPAAGDTTLTGEITTAGLTRQVGTYAHTTGAASYTITTTFTAQAADVPVTVGKRGIFDAITGGNLVFETLVSPTATLSAVGDTLTLTDTISV